MRRAGSGDRRPRRPARVPPRHDHARRRPDDRRAVRPRRAHTSRGEHASGRRPGRDDLSGPAARTPGWAGHRLAHHDPRRWSRPRLRAPPRHPLPVDPLRARVGPCGLRGPGSAVPLAGRRLRAATARHPSPRARQLTRSRGRRDRVSRRRTRRTSTTTCGCRPPTSGRTGSSAASDSSITARRRPSGSRGAPTGSSAPTPASVQRRAEWPACATCAAPAPRAS